MSFTDFLENEILDHIFTDGAYSPPTTLYLALSDTTPTDAGGNVTEPTNGSYAREPITNAEMDAASAGSKDNGTVLQYPTATANYDASPITHWVLYDAVTAGNAMAYAALTDQTKSVNNGDTAEFGAGNFAMTLN